MAAGLAFRTCAIALAGEPSARVGIPLNTSRHMRLQSTLLASHLSTIMEQVRTSPIHELAYEHVNADAEEARQIAATTENFMVKESR